MSKSDKSKWDEQAQGLDWSLARRILQYTRPYMQFTVVGVITALLIAVLQPVPALIQRHVIDDYLTPYISQTSQYDFAAIIDGIMWMSLLYAGIKLFEFILRYISTLAIGYLGQNVLRDVRADIFSKLQSLHLQYYDKNPVGRLLTRVTSDVDAINQFITGGLITLITSGFLIVVYVIFMLRLNWQLALISFSVLPILFFATNFFRSKMRESFRETRLHQATVNTKLNEHITGMQTVQLFGREKRSALDFDYSNRDLLGAFSKSVYWFSLFMPVVAWLGQLAIALVVFFGAYKMLGTQGAELESAITIGTLFAFVQWTQQLFLPIQDLADVFNNLQSAMVSGERIFEVLDTEEEIKDSADAKQVTDFKGNVEFNNVWFAYDDQVTNQTPETDERWILRGVDLNIAAGESVALVGATGAGKTSVTALVSRFYDVQRGHVSVDDLDVRDIAQHSLRKHVGVVLQDVFLFAGTIESNLRLNDMAISDEKIVEACKYVGVHDYIMTLENGYQTEVRERGATLSTGQKQLIAFARALIQNPDILLVLDEATSNVDTETELRIQQALTKLMKGRTSIIIAHRLSTIEHCNRIIVMRRGQIVEQGSHVELLAKGGYYSKLHTLQYAKQQAAD